jgi:hypothetical protein
MATHKLKSFNFIGSEYHVPAQQLSGLVCTFWSANTRWLDDSLPFVSTWSEWKAYGRDSGDSLMGENWMHNYFTDHNMLPSCYFLSPSEFSDYILSDKIQTLNNTEPGLLAYLSELFNHQLILFIHLYSPTGSLSFTLSRNGISKSLTLNSGTVYWETFDKSGHIKIQSKEQTKEFFIDPAKEYTDTLFKFDDDRLKCLKEM